MTDYLQELEFGLFPAPEADRAEEVLALVQLAEVLGLDVASVQDHPYQAKYLDTWTLLSFLGASQVGMPRLAQFAILCFHLFTRATISKVGVHHPNPNPRSLSETNRPPSPMTT